MWLKVGMPHYIWTKAINIVTFLINHSLIRVNPQMTLFQRLFKIMPMFDHVRMFGNWVFIFIVKDEQDKLNPKLKLDNY
jgi:hypothetical protein